MDGLRAADPELAARVDQILAGALVADPSNPWCCVVGPTVALEGEPAVVVDERDPPLVDELAALAAKRDDALARCGAPPARLLSPSLVKAREREAAREERRAMLVARMRDAKLGTLEGLVAEDLLRRIVADPDGSNEQTWLEVAMEACVEERALLNDVLRPGRHDGEALLTRHRIFFALHRTHKQPAKGIGRVFLCDKNTVTEGARAHEERIWVGGTPTLHRARWVDPDEARDVAEGDRS